MKRILLLTLLLAACGLPDNLQVAYVSPEILPVFTAFRNDLREAAGYDIFIDSPDGIRIVGDTEAVDSVNQKTGQYVGGFWDPFRRVVVLPRPGERLSYKNGTKHFTPEPGYYEVLMAHELAHAMGLGHSATGLMFPIATDECIGRAALCFLDALAIPRLPTD